MKNLTFAFCRLEINYISRIAFTIAMHMHRLEVTITTTQLVLTNTFIVRLTFCHLRIVNWLFVIEDTNVLMFSQRLFLCIQEVRWLRFLPYPFILEEFRLAHNQCSSKQTLRGQYNSTIRLNDTLVLSPQFIERNYTVPLILCRAIRQITQHHVNTVIGQMAHHFDAVTLNDTINKLVFSPILLWHLFAISSASTISP